MFRDQPANLGLTCGESQKHTIIWKSQRESDSITIRREEIEESWQRTGERLLLPACVTGVYRRPSSILGELGSPGCNSINLLDALGSKALVGSCELGSHIQAFPDGRKKERKCVRVQRGSSFMFLAESCGYEPRATSQSAVGGKGWPW